MPMRAPLRTHLSIQRKNLLKVALYGAEAFGLCLLGIWIFRNDIALQWKLVISGALGGFVFLVGVVMVLFVSYSTLTKAEGNSVVKD
jgi:hypothetical protein